MNAFLRTTDIPPTAIKPVSWRIIPIQEDNKAPGTFSKRPRFLCSMASRGLKYNFAGITKGNGYATTSPHSTSACSKTVCVAFSCLSGG